MEPKRNEVATTATTALTPMDMLDRAVAANASVETMGQLMALQERWQAGKAREVFIQARADAKAEIAKSVILKNREGHNKKRYADFSAYAKVIDPILAEHGLSYGFETDHSDGRITVTCVLSHAEGHETRNSLSGPPDQTGSKNAIQAIGSTVTYLQRYTLTAALGLSASEDDDGAASEGPPAAISEDQAKELHDLLQATDADTSAFLNHFEIDSVEALPAVAFERAKKMLEMKQARAKK